MKKLPLLLCTLSLSACMGAIKPDGQAPDSYDFGPQRAQDKIASRLPLDAIDGTGAIDTRRIRYRLNYRNPTQVLTYLNSRWSAPPAELLQSQLLYRSDVQPPCALRLQITAFEQIFDSASDSHGTVQLRATLLQQQSRLTLQQQWFDASAAAPTADAAGGVAALRLAANDSLRQAVSWAETAAVATPQCQP